MARKGVNLLDDDNWADLEGEGSARGKKPGKGGGLIRALVLVVVVLAVLAGGAWGGYQFWWLPRLEREQERLRRARQRLEELRKRRLAQLKVEAEQREKALALLQRAQTEKREEAKQRLEESRKKRVAQVKEEAQKRPEAKEKGEEKGPSVGPAPKPRPPVGGRVAKGPPAPKAGSTPEAPAAKASVPPSVAAQESAQKVAKPQAPKPRAPREVPPPAAPARSPKAASPPRAAGGKGVASPTRTPSSSRPAAPKGVFFSVQVAACRTERCVQTFVRRLREKGFESYVTGRYSLPPLTEVLLGAFPAKAEADALVARARREKIRVSSYRAGGMWRVSAGAFADLEDAAQRLDQVEDAGLKGELSSSRRAAGAGLRAVRTGRFPTRKEALAMRARVLRAGFPGSFVIRQRARK